jgi:hypothetical protein
MAGELLALLPRHLQIIYDQSSFPAGSPRALRDEDRLRRMSLIEEGRSG